jgi:hypothetical protein
MVDPACRPRRLLVGILCRLFLASILTKSAFAQYATSYERVLLPVYVNPNNPRPGINGSLWITRVTITNRANAQVSVYPYVQAVICCGGGVWPPILPNSSFSPLEVPFASDTRGPFVYVDRAYIDDVQITLRTQDVSREAETLGTVIPVARETDFTGKTFTLNDIPVSDQFRQTLRVYGFDAEDATPIRLQLYGLAEVSEPHGSDELLGQFDIQLRPSTFDKVSRPPYPAYLEITNLGLIGSTKAYARVRVDVAPLVPDRKLWAFASITHNQTQHVTIITPMR